MKDCSWSYLIHSLVGLMAERTDSSISGFSLSHFSVIDFYISYVGITTFTGFLLSYSLSCIFSYTRNSYKLAPYFIDSSTFRFMMYFRFLFITFRILLLYADIKSYNVLESFINIWLCNFANLFSSYTHKTRRCLPVTKAFRVYEIWSWMYNGW